MWLVCIFSHSTGCLFTLLTVFGIPSSIFAFVSCAFHCISKKKSMTRPMSRSFLPLKSTLLVQVWWQQVHSQKILSAWAVGSAIGMSLWHSSRQILGRSMQSSFPRKGNMALPTPHCSLAPDQRLLRTQVASHLLKFLYPQCPNPQLQPSPYHNVALDLEQTQQRRGNNFALLLSRTVNSYTSSA